MAAEKLGRNDPCHCGSNRKYKQCHQREDAAREKEQRDLKTLAAWTAYYGRALRESVPAPELGDLAQRWFTEVPADPLSDANFRDHLYCDIGDPPAIAGATIDDAEPTGDFAKLREAFATSRVSLLWVTECKPGKGVRVEDRLEGAERWLPGAEIAEELEPLEVIFARVLVIGERATLAEGWQRVEFRKRKAAVADLQAQIDASGAAEDDAAARAEWVAANAPAIAQRAWAAGLR